MGVFIIVLQVAGTILTGLNVWHNYGDYQAYQAGAVEATASGFYLPFARDVLTSLLGITAVIGLPKWREVLSFVRLLLPENKPATPGAAIQSLIDAANAESLQNTIEQGKILALTLSGQVLPPFTPKTAAKEALAAALSKLSTGGV